MAEERPKKATPAQPQPQPKPQNPAILFIIFTEFNPISYLGYSARMDLSMSFEPPSGSYHRRNGTLVDIHGSNRIAKDST